MMAAVAHALPGPSERDKLRAWLEYVVETGIAMLDDLDAAGEDLEDSEAGCE